MSSDTTNHPGIPVPPAAVIAWQGYMADVDDVMPRDIRPDDVPTKDDAINNTMGDTLEAFVLIEATEVSDANAPLRVQLAETARALGVGIRSLVAARAEVERRLAQEELLDLPPKAFALQWEAQMADADGGAEVELLDVLRRARPAQRGAVPATSLGRALESADAAVRSAAVQATATIGRGPRK